MSAISRLYTRMRKSLNWSEGVIKQVKAPAIAKEPEVLDSEDSDSTGLTGLDRNGVFSRIIGKGNEIVAIDVGGASDLQPHWHKMRSVSQFIVYEPNQQSFDELIDRQKSTEAYSNFLYINLGLAGSSGMRTLYVTNVATGSSLLPINELGIGVFNRSEYFFPVKPQMVQVDTLARSLDHIGKNDIHIIKLDTQGTEIEILSGLDANRIEGLLAIEIECGFLDYYCGENQSLDSALEFARKHNFQLFDLRCNRFHGSAPRFGLEYLRTLLGADVDLPPSAHRINEVDAVFFRETRHFIKGRPTQASIRRFLVLLCVYNFYLEALAATKLAEEEGLVDQSTSTDLINCIRRAYEIESDEFKFFKSHPNYEDKLHFAQYMWVPIPSS